MRNADSWRALRAPFLTGLAMSLALMLLPLAALGDGSTTGVGSAGRRGGSSAVAESPSAAKGRSIRARLMASPVRNGARSARQVSAFRKSNTSIFQISGESTEKSLIAQQSSTTKTN